MTTVDVLNFPTLVARQKGLDIQRRAADPDQTASDRASVRRTYAVYYVQKSAAYAEITHQRRTADF